MIDNNDSVYFESLSLLKNFLYNKIQYILQKKFPFLFEKTITIKKEEVIQSEEEFLLFITTNKIVLDRFYLYRLKKRLTDFEFELLMLMFFSLEDIKFNALMKKIKDPDKIPLSEEDYYEISLNEALELLVNTDKEKFILRKSFLLNSYLFKHKIITFSFSENVSDNPLIFNENLKMSLHTVSKIISIDPKEKELKSDIKFANRLKIGDDGF